MKTIADKSSSTTSTTVTQSEQPFFAKGNKGAFRQPVTHPTLPAVQMKMAVNKPRDKLEQEDYSREDKGVSPSPLASPEQEEKLRRQADEKNQKTALPKEKIQRKGDGSPSVVPNRQSAIQAKTTDEQPHSEDVPNNLDPQFHSRSNEVRDPTLLTNATVAEGEFLSEAQPAHARSPGTPSPQTTDALSNSEAGPSIQSATDQAGKGSSKNGNKNTTPEGATSPASEMGQVANGEAGKKDDASSVLLGRIAEAPRSSIQIEAITQASLINKDGLNSELQVSRIAATRRQNISAHFSGVRFGISDFFSRSLVAVHGFIAGKQAEIIGAAMRALASVRNAITDTVQAAQALGMQIRARLALMLGNIKTAVQSRVAGIAGKITGLINSVPLPDIPGIAQIRGTAVSLLNRAANILNSAFGHLVGFIAWAFSVGMNLLDSLLRGVTLLVNLALSLASSAILSVLQLIGHALNRAIAFIGSTLSRALLGVLIPILKGIESLLVGLISRAEQRALALLRRNRKEYLFSLAEAVIPKPASQGAKASSTENQIAVILKIGRDAMQNNQMILQTFDELTSGTFGSIIRVLAAIASQIIGTITGLFAKALQALETAVTQAIQLLSQLVQAVTAFLGKLIQAFMDGLKGLVNYVGSLVQGAVEQLIQFAKNSLTRISSVIRRLVKNLILGRGITSNVMDVLGIFSLPRVVLPFRGPLPPPPGVIITIIIAILSAIVAFLGGTVIVIGSTVLIIIGGTVITTTVTVVVIVAVVVLLLLLLLIYLIYRWLTKPKPPPGKRVIRVTPSSLELGVGGRRLTNRATIAPGTPARPPLLWTINPGGTVPPGVSVSGIGRRVPVRAAHPPHGIVVGGTPVTVRASLLTNPADFADSAPIMMVQVLTATYVAIPALAPVPSLIPGTPPVNSAEPNRDGISGNTANVDVTSAPAGRSIRIVLRRSLGANVAGTTITPGRKTGDIGLRITDVPTRARLDETQPSTAGPAALMKDLTVNAVPLKVSALAGAGPLGPYGVRNTIIFNPSDALHPPLTRIVGELITHITDGFNVPPPNNGFNPVFNLNLAVPANSWNDQLVTPAGILNASDNRPAIDVNRFVGIGVPQLPRRLIYRQRFQYSSWQGAGTAISRTIANGRHIRSLIGAPGSFQFTTEHRFPGATAPKHTEPYVGNPLIVLSNIVATPSPVPSGTASTTVTLNAVPGGRTVNWSLDSSATAAGVTVTPNVTGPGVGPMIVSVTRPGGFTGRVTVIVSDSVFAARTGRVKIRFL